MQPLRPLNSTEPPFRPEAGPANFPPVNQEQSNLRLFKFLASLGLQTSNLGQCGTASSVVQKESPCTVFFSFIFSATLQNFLFKQVCSRHTMRVQAQGEQLHQAHLVIPCTVIYPHICASEHFVTVTSDYDHVLCASVQTLCCVPLCTATE